MRWKRFDESSTLTTLQESADDRAPFLIETAVRDRFAGLPIPVRGVRVVSFAAVQIGMHPRSIRWRTRRRYGRN